MIDARWKVKGITTLITVHPENKVTGIHPPEIMELSEFRGSPHTGEQEHTLRDRLWQERQFASGIAGLISVLISS